MDDSVNSEKTVQIILAIYWTNVWPPWESFHHSVMWLYRHALIVFIAGSILLSTQKLQFSYSTKSYSSRVTSDHSVMYIQWLVHKCFFNTMTSYNTIFVTAISQTSWIQNHTISLYPRLIFIKQCAELLLLFWCVLLDINPLHVMCCLCIIRYKPTTCNVLPVYY